MLSRRTRPAAGDTLRDCPAGRFLQETCSLCRASPPAAGSQDGNAFPTKPYGMKDLLREPSAAFPSREGAFTPTTPHPTGGENPQGFFSSQECAESLNRQRVMYNGPGGMAERFKAAVLKTADREVRGFESLSLRQLFPGQARSKNSSAAKLTTDAGSIFHCWYLSTLPLISVSGLREAKNV